MIYQDDSQVGGGLNSAQGQKLNTTVFAHFYSNSAEGINSNISKVGLHLWNMNQSVFITK